MKQLSSFDIDKLLNDLKFGAVPHRIGAARKLAEVAVSNEQIVATLMLAKETDDFPDVRLTAAQALLSPVHQIFTEQNADTVTRLAAELKAQVPDILLQRAQRKKIDIQQLKGREKNWLTRISLMSVAIFIHWIYIWGISDQEFRTVHECECGSIVILGAKSTAQVFAMHSNMIIFGVLAIGALFFLIPPLGIGAKVEASTFSNTLVEKQMAFRRQEVAKRRRRALLVIILAILAFGALVILMTSVK